MASGPPQAAFWIRQTRYAPSIIIGSTIIPYLGGGGIHAAFRSRAKQLCIFAAGYLIFNVHPGKIPSLFTRWESCTP